MLDSGTQPSASSYYCVDDPLGATGVVNDSGWPLYYNNALVLTPCSDAATQQWGVPGAPTVRAKGPVVSVGVSGACLDDYQVATFHGAPVDVYPCNYGQSQSWTLMSDGTLQVNGVCLTANGSKPNPSDSAHPYMTANLYPCNLASTGSAQKWSFNSAGELVSALTQGCVDDTDSSLGATGIGLIITTCTGAPTQQWYMPGSSDAPQVQLTGGDVTVSVDDGGLDPNMVRQVINNVMPVSLGLPAGTPIG